MYVLCLSNEPLFPTQIKTAFANRIDEVDCRTDLEEFLTSARSGEWDVLLVDLDALTSEYSNPLEFCKQLGSRPGVLILGPSRLSEQREEIESAGHKLMLKPAVIGEIGLALHKLVADEKLRNAN